MSEYKHDTIESRFIPKSGERFFLLNGHGYIVEEMWEGTESNWSCWRWGNVFRTAESALANYEAHKDVNLGWRYE